jgi:hypothetical protein
MKLLADEDFNGRIVRGLLRRFPALDLVRVQDVGLIEHHDTLVLAWAAQENRLVLTHDFATMIDFAYNRIAENLPMPGVIAVPQDLAIGETIDEILLLIECSDENEWDNQVVFIPLK